MPTDNGRGLYDRQGISPAGPPLREDDSKGSVQHTESQPSPAAGPDQGHDLLAQRQVLEGELLPRPKQRSRRPEDVPSTGQGGEFLTEGQFLDHEVTSRAQSRAKRRQQGNEEAKHRAGEDPGLGPNRQWFQHGSGSGDPQPMGIAEILTAALSRRGHRQQWQSPL